MLLGGSCEVKYIKIVEIYRCIYIIQEGGQNLNKKN